METFEPHSVGETSREQHVAMQSKQ